ncbi:MAG: fibronectin type III domain-containing protein [Bacteroidetes bacterium]|nr:fibronectin type III domain-containing protein [Bacteroidota bacterium]
MKKNALSVLMLLGAFAAKSFAQCDAPVNLNASYSNNVSTFTWDNVSGANAYNLELKFQWDSQFTPLATVSVNSFSISGIFQTAPLEWRVNADCGNAVSAYSATQPYSTPCPEPASLSVSNITGTSATLNWVPESGYNTNTSDFVVSYRLANTSNSWISLGHTSSPTKNVTSLLSSTTYEWRVYQSCMYANGNYVYGQFTTAYLPCDAPTNLILSNVASSTANVSWAGVSGGLTYSVEYKTANSSNWSTPLVTSANNTSLSGLTPSTLYDIRVKATCASGTSTYITSQFTTYSSVCAAYGANSSEFIDYFKIGSITRTSGKETGGYVNTNLNTNLVIGSNNAGQFSAGFNPGIVFGEYYAIYIDFNRNGSFTDAGERVVSPTYVNSGSAVYNFNISIPTTATQGLCKMRVIMRRSNSNITPCATNFKGEVEDYNVTLVTGSNKTDNENTGSLDTKGLVYPNPSNGEFTFEMPIDNTIKSYTVTNMYGQVIVNNVSVNDSYNQFQLDLSNFPKGIYILTVQDANNKFQTHKLQKN